MRQKFTMMAALVVCFAMAFGGSYAADREIDYTGDRSKQRLMNGNQTPETNAVDMRDTFSDAVANRSLVSRVNNATGAAKASALLSAAKLQEGSDAIATLNQVLNMELPDTAEGDKILAEAYRLLGLNFGDTPSKQAGYFGLALQYTSEPAPRAWLEGQINALGADIVDMAFLGDNAVNGTRDFGVADTCDEAISIGFGTTAPFTIEAGGDSDWFALDVNTASGGALFTIETITDDPGGFTDDTNVTVYDGCDAGTPGNQIGFSEDDGVDFMSLLSFTSCTPNGTYYIDVGGWQDAAAADNITMDVRLDGECVPPTPDAFEPDNDRENATFIGRLVSGNPFGLFKGTIKKEIQRHNFFPAPDTDFVYFLNLRSELVRMQTSCQFPTVFNDFAFCDEDEDGVADADPDTILFLLTNSEEDYGGRCNDQSNGFANTCSVDLDCDLNMNGDPNDDLVDPVVGLPVCIDLELFAGTWDFDPPLAFNDDRGGGNFGSELAVCLPSGIKPFSGSATVQGDPTTDFYYYFYVETIPFTATDISEYEIFVHKEAECVFEVEPNQDFADASPLVVNGSTHGFYDFSETAPLQDADLFEFDIDEQAGFDGSDRLVSISTNGYDANAVDTFIELIVGPDEVGDYFLTGVSDEDGGTGFLSRIDVILPTADNLLGITLPPDVAEDCLNAPPAAPFWWPDFLPWWGDLKPQPEYCGPSYILNVTSNYLNPNFPYEVITEVAEPPAAETEPNDDCATTGESAALGDDYLADIDPACDFDTYKFTLTEDTEVSIATGGTGDTTIRLVDCNTNAVLACDDDGGAGLLSLVDGCLPPGEYCIEARAFSSTATFAYDISFGGGASCVADSPPVVNGDEGLGCPAFDTCP